jgi:hypothetical protein
MHKPDPNPPPSWPRNISIAENPYPEIFAKCSSKKTGDAICQARSAYADVTDRVDVYRTVLRSRKMIKTFEMIFAALALFVLAAPALAMDIRPDPQNTQGSVRIDGHTVAMTCGYAKDHRGAMTRDRRDEVQIRYGLPTGPHPDYEIDHLIPLCLGGADDPLQPLAAAAPHY